MIHPPPPPNEAKSTSRYMDEPTPLQLHSSSPEDHHHQQLQRMNGVHLGRMRSSGTLLNDSSEGASHPVADLDGMMGNKRIVCWMDGAALSLNHRSFSFVGPHAFMVAANYYQLSKLIDIIALLAQSTWLNSFMGHIQGTWHPVLSTAISMWGCGVGRFIKICGK